MWVEESAAHDEGKQRGVSPSELWTKMTGQVYIVASRGFSCDRWIQVAPWTSFVYFLDDLKEAVQCVFYETDKNHDKIAHWTNLKLPRNDDPRSIAVTVKAGP